MTSSLPPPPLYPLLQEAPPDDRADEALPAFDGPRERLVRSGAQHLGDDDLLAVLLGTGCAAEPVQQLASRLLEEHAGLAGLALAGAPSLARTRGIGATKAARIAAAIELGRRAAHVVPPPTRIRSAEDVDALLRPRLAHLEAEHFVALALDARHRVIRELWISKGTMTACLVSVADVYRQVLREAAPAVLFVHNHPSGETEPSHDDLHLTRRLVEAADLLGLRVVDHVIVAREGFRSLRDSGLMPSHAIATSSFLRP
ncbi:MAG: DNA repair protein RadC [Sandaracinaceae bacterium]|nr:DNA repair protein RadC [Sandaracinaceae bacterium]